MILKTFFLAVLISALALASAPAIGIVTASGHFTLDRSQVWGNATVFEGSVIETGSASSEIALRSGAKLQLAKDSRARILSDRAVIEKGIGQISAPESFEVNVANLRIHSTGRLRITLNDGVQIASLFGSARVASPSGMLLASIPAGRAMNFSPQAANGVVTRTGCLMYKDNHYIMQDENTQEVVELSGGQNLNSQLGNRVEITGTASTAKPAVSIATLVVSMITVTPKSSGGCLSVATNLGAQTDVANAPTSPTESTTAPAAKTGGGLSTGAKVAIIVVIAGGGAGAAIALAGKKGSTSP
ncbi:MAG TPA: hypothetical protein VK752_32320 [Bryobacteraceae bacterium]|nr:hypothetical protein [Bryobacteraceae bacterium]